MATEFEATFESEELRNFLRTITQRTREAVEVSHRYAGLISVLVFRDVMEHFEKEEGSAGPWKDLTAAYKKRRPPGKKLQVSGKLRQSFQPGNYKVVSGQGLYWFNNAQTAKGFGYAALHNKGGKFQPKRDFMWLSAIAMERISKQTLLFMVDEGL